ncbi:MAG: hypothetical protein AVDCRST_MAG65-1316, partial [uncultured Solirubrobacteraceae bacterium]
GADSRREPVPTDSRPPGRPGPFGSAAAADRQGPTTAPVDPAEPGRLRPAGPPAGLPGHRLLLTRRPRSHGGAA